MGNDLLLPDRVGPFVLQSPSTNRLVEIVQGIVVSFSHLREMEDSDEVFGHSVAVYRNEDKAKKKKIPYAEVLVRKLSGNKGPGSVRVNICYGGTGSSEHIVYS